MTITEMKDRKRELGYSVRELSELTDVPVGTLNKIFSGATSSPRRDTLKRIEKILGDPGMSGRGDNVEVYKYGKRVVKIIKENNLAYNVKTSYTLDDYLDLPEDKRVELIDGVFYDMGAPHTLHQNLVGYIYNTLLNYSFEKKTKCRPMLSPVDVQLDMDDKTVVQPDVIIICDYEKFKNGRIFGAPEFVVEILSPSTRKKDMTLKLYKYQNAGVQEYWIVDPKNKEILVYDLEHFDFPKIYGPEDKIPVKLWDGECEVDMKEAFEYSSIFYD